MFKKLSYLILSMWLSALSLSGQTDSLSVSFRLENLYDRLSKNFDDSFRIRINDSIQAIVESYVQSDTVFNHKFGNIRYLGQITSPDSIIKIVTWNLVLSDQSGRYYCYIIRKNQHSSKNKVYSLTSKYKPDLVKADTNYTSDQWYGALYYDIKPEFINGKNCWLLLGIDYGNPDITRKIIEILTFDKDDGLSFGMKVFESAGTLSYREVFEYSATATMTLRFSGDDSIVFDHLVPFAPEMINDRRYYGPQYTNDAYVPENGLWRFKLNVDARNKE
jgi:hypothetical protein